MTPGTTHSNPVLDSALNHTYAPYATQTGRRKIVAFGDHSDKCPVYALRIPPCSAACPAGTDVRGMHNLLTGVEKSDDAWRSAWERVVEKNPFPAITGRICPHPCETACNRVQHDESVGINAVEMAIGDHGIRENLSLPGSGAPTGRRVAVVGGGPAGLAATYHLRLLGHEVTLYDAHARLGGMMRYGIMSYRVSREILEAEIQRILELGVETKLGIRVGSDISLESLESQYDAVFIGVGAQVGRSLILASTGDRPEVTDAISFLKGFEMMGEDFAIGTRVLVVGDGDVSMDVARLALRLGSEADVVSAVPRDEMACIDEEYDAAAAEGVKVHFLTGAVGVAEEGDRIRGLVCTKMEKKPEGEPGWNSSIPYLRYRGIPGETFEISGDMIVASIGQTTDMTGLEELTKGTPFLKLDRNGKVVGKTSVFGGGDAQEIDLIATAVGHGWRSARSIDRFLHGRPPAPPDRQDLIESGDMDISFYPHSSPQKRSLTSLLRVSGDFNELLGGLGSEEAVAEAERCMSCGLCFECGRCEMFCPHEAISESPQNSRGEVMHTNYRACVGCHICSLICPCGYIQMGLGEAD